MNRQYQNKRAAAQSGISAILYTLFLPLDDNTGCRMVPEQVNHVFQEIVSYAGGLTQFQPDVGFWVDPTCIAFRDHVLPIQVLVEAERDAETRFIKWAAELAELETATAGQRPAS